MFLQLVKNEMANLILTNCGFLVPPDRVCFGSSGYKEQGLCEDCQIYAEKKKSAFLFKKARINGSERVHLIHQPCGVTVEASY
jgi:hypothetical protein